MQYRRLGLSGLLVSEIGFGCMSLSPNPEKESENLLRLAVDAGINYFDTADLYDKGENEIIVGRALKPVRHKVVIATKVGNQWRDDGSGWDWNPSKKHILSSVEQSLRRLQTDCIDLYQLHGGTMEDPFDDTIDAFEQLKREGKIRQYGISSIRPTVIREYARRSSIVSVMTQYSLADRRPEEQTLDLLDQRQISVLARGSLAQGLLVDKPAKEYLGYSKDEVAAIAGALRLLSGKERTTAQTAIQYVLKHPAVASAVVGIRTVDQLREISVGVAPLSDGEFLQLQNTAKANIYGQHRIDNQTN